MSIEMSASCLRMLQATVMEQMDDGVQGLLSLALNQFDIALAAYINQWGTMPDFETGEGIATVACATVGCPKEVFDDFALRVGQLYEQSLM